MNDFRLKIQRFMQGRYGCFGNDSLNKFLFAASIVSLILSMFLGRIFWLVGLFCLVYAYYRTFSRNCQKRSAENMKYLNSTQVIRKNVNKYKTMWRQRKSYKFFKCPMCKQQIRVPKGHGRVEVRCPKCRSSFQGNT